MLLAEATTTNYHDLSGASSFVAKNPATDASKSIGDNHAQEITKTGNVKGTKKPFSNHLDTAIEQESTEANSAAKRADGKIDEVGENRAKRNSKKWPVGAEMLVGNLDLVDESGNDRPAAASLRNDTRNTRAKTRSANAGDISSFSEPAEIDAVVAKRLRDSNARLIADRSVIKSDKSGVSGAGTPLEITKSPADLSGSESGNRAAVNVSAGKVASSGENADSGAADIRHEKESELASFKRIDVVDQRSSTSSGLEAGAAAGTSSDAESISAKGDRVASAVDRPDRGPSAADAIRVSPSAANGEGAPTGAELGAGEGENAFKGDTDGSELQARSLRLFSSEAIGDDNSPGTERSTRFSRMFHERMQPEIVRQSTVVLKGSGRGEIRMTLRPENLGNLRMRLALDQNRVTGRIIVESSAVKMLLDQNLESLSRSFRESGFDAANFEVTVSGGDQNHHSKNQQREVAYDGTASRNATQKMDETASLVEATADTTINLVV